MTANIGTTQYVAPEIILDLPYNEKCDVYSFGIVMYELLFERTPFQEVNDDYGSIISSGNMITLSIDVAQKGRRPIIPEYDKNDIRSFSDAEGRYINIMTKCWQHNAENRPSFDDVFEQINDIRQQL